MTVSEFNASHHGRKGEDQMSKLQLVTASTRAKFMAVLPLI